jgi:hypothetical protein
MTTMSFVLSRGINSYAMVDGPIYCGEGASVRLTSKDALFTLPRCSFFSFF